MIRMIFCCAILLVCVNVGAQTFDAAKADSLLARLQRHHKAMGAVSVYKNGKPVYERGFGYAVTEKDIPNTPQTVFKIGSISKTFTAVLIFKLIEEKKLRPEDKLGKWFPDIPNAANITLEQMLGHRSGIANYTNETDFADWAQQPQTQAALLARLEKAQPDFEPGAKVEYSNTNYLLLGWIIEKVAGRSYHDVLKEKITQPLGLSRTDNRWPAKEKTPETRGYTWNGKKWLAEPNTPWLIAGAAGGIYSTVRDMNVFITSLLQGKVVQESSLKKMMATNKEGMGSGLIKSPFYNKYSFGHNGYIDNFSSDLSYYPEDSVSVAVVLNATNTNFNDLMIGLLSIYYNKKYELPDFEKEIELPEATLRQYEGVYRYEPINMDITVRLEQGQLTAQATGQGAFPLTAQSETEFVFDAAGILIQFDEIQNGKARILMLHQSGSNIPFARRE